MTEVNLIKLTLDQRRRAMARNRGRTKPERALASRLWIRGLRYLTSAGYQRRYGHRLLGSPDIVFPRKRVVVFVDGCFWHGCAECRRMPDGYDPVWIAKIARNIERDKFVTEQLQILGWTVLRVPEHAVRKKSRLAETADALVGKLTASTLETTPTKHTTGS